MQSSKKYFILFLLFFTRFCAAQHATTQANSEADLSCIIAGVNAITGSYSFIVPVYSVPGAQPLHFYHHFNSHDYLQKTNPFWSRSYYGFLGIETGEIENREHLLGLYVEDGRSSILLVQPRRERHINLKLSHTYKPTRGVTNTSHGLISAATNLDNLKVCLDGRKSSEAIVTKPDGTIQNFYKYDKLNKRRRYRLDEHISPNSNRYFPQYKDKSTITGIRFTNSLNELLFEETYSYLRYDKQLKYHYAQSLFSDGQIKYHAFLCFEKYDWVYSLKLKEYVYEKIKCNYIAWLDPLDGPMEYYRYKNRGVYSYARLTKREKPGGRYLNIAYNDVGKESFLGHVLNFTETSAQVGRVKQISAPAAPGGEEAALYSFIYNINQDYNDPSLLYEGFTLVIDGRGNHKRYVYDRNHRIIHIDHVGDNTEYYPYRQDSFSWSDNGRLQHRYFLGDGGTQHYKRFEYDDQGNVLKEHTCASFSLASTPFEMVDGLPVSDVECKTVENTYTKDGFNSLCTTNDGQIFTCYSYLRGTNLPARKQVTDQKNISLRTFYTYDKNKALIEEINDDGTGETSDDLTNVSFRTIRKLTPKMKGGGIGLPLVEELYGYDLFSGTEKLISKVVNTYDANYKIAKQETYDSNNRYAHTKEWIYNKRGQLEQEIDALGNVTTYAYDPNYNCIHKLVSSGQKEYFFTYDLMNRLIKEELRTSEGQSYTTCFRYDVMGNKTAEIDTRGFMTEYIYDVHGRCIEIRMPEIEGRQAILKQEYDVFDNVIAQTDAEGNVTRTQYNSFKQPVSVTYADGSQEGYRYDLYNRLIEKREKNGSKKCFSYDGLSRLLKETILDSKGTLVSTQTNHYDAFHLLSSTNAMGLTTTYAYDYAGRLIEERTLDKRTTKEYDALGRIAKEILHNATQTKITEFNYDLKNQLLSTKITDLSGNLLSYTSSEYDQQGRQTLISRYDEQGRHSTLIEYDALDRPIKVTLPDNSYFYALYEDDHSEGLRKTLYTPDGRQVLSCFDGLGRLVLSEKRNVQGDFIDRKQCFYDLNNQLLKEEYTVFPSERTVTNCYAYDPMGHLIEQIEGLGDPRERLTNYSYNLSGEKESTTKADGTKLFYSYDALGRLSHEFSSDQSIDTYWEYNLNNAPTRIQDKQSLTLRSYDLYGRLTQEHLGNDLTLRYDYDLADRLTALTYPDNTTAHYSYNPLSLTQITYKDQTIRYHYDSYGNLTALDLANGDSISYQYDALARLKEVVAKLFSQTEFSYDLIGNLISYKLNGVAHHFTYDDHHHLIAEEGPLNHTYGYDSLHNRLQKDNDSYAYDALNQIVSSDCDYDDNGNLLRYKDHYYSYDALDRLLTVTTPTLTESYTYDPFHRRLTKGDTLYAYQDTHELGAFENGACLEKRILGIGNGGEVGAAVLIELDAQLYTPYHDHRGNICALAQTHITDTFTYNAFGEENPSSSRNPYRFCSKRHDASGLIYFGYRYYHPQLGRWLTPDPIGFQDGPNRYAYCVNNPVNKIDLYGLYGSFWGGDEYDTWSFDNSDRSDFHSNSWSICHNSLKGSAHGGIDFLCNSVHAFETMFAYSGAADAGFDLHERYRMIGGLSACQADRMAALDQYIYNLCGITEPCESYQLSRSATSQSIHYGMLACGAYGLARAGCSLYSAMRGLRYAEMEMASLGSAEASLAKLMGREVAAGESIFSELSLPQMKQKAAHEIAFGHAWKKHKIIQNEFSWINTQEELAQHVEYIMTNSTELRILEADKGTARIAYWHKNTETVVIWNTKSKDQGTVMQPRRKYDYFREVE